MSWRKSRSKIEKVDCVCVCTVIGPLRMSASVAFLCSGEQVYFISPLTVENSNRAFPLRGYSVGKLVVNPH